MGKRSRNRVRRVAGPDARLRRDKTLHGLGARPDAEVFRAVGDQWDQVDPDTALINDLGDTIRVDDALGQVQIRSQGSVSLSPEAALLLSERLVEAWCEQRWGGQGWDFIERWLRPAMRAAWADYASTWWDSATDVEPKANWLRDAPEHFVGPPEAPEGHE